MKEILQFLRSPLIVGVIALLSGPVAAASLTIVYSFTGGSDGANPGAPLLWAGGNLYGTAIGGGHGNGVVFVLNPAASPASPTVLYTFPGKPKLLSVNPGLVQDRRGNLYGSTSQSQKGYVFALDAPRTPGTAWRIAKLASFPGIESTLGGGPSGVLALENGNATLIGVTQAGGDESGQFPCQCGVIYTVGTAKGQHAEQVISTFGSPPDGDIPVAGLTQANDDLGHDALYYGTTWLGGEGRCLDGSDVAVVGCGTVYQLGLSGGIWTRTTIYSFRTHEGNEPVDPVTAATDGALYGYAGLDVYQLTRGRKGTWQKHTLYSFPGGISGTAPTGAPVFDAAGNIYGATRSFGIEGPATVFELSPPAAAGAPWTATTLATLPGGNDAAQPLGGLIMAPDGVLYGAASTLGPGTGYIFSVVP